MIEKPVVAAVSRSATHDFSKHNEERVQLRAGLGVDGDAHAGVTVKHRSRVARDPSQPNLRQVHLIHAELHDDVDEHVQQTLDVFAREVPSSEALLYEEHQLFEGELRARSMYARNTARMSRVDVTQVVIRLVTAQLG